MLKKRDVPKNLEEFYRHIKPDAGMFEASPERYRNLYIHNCLSVIQDCIHYGMIETFEVALGRHFLKVKILFASEEEVKEFQVDLRRIE